MSLLTRILFKIARSPVASLFIGAAFEHLSALIPLDRRYEDRHVVVFRHPRPFFTFHMVAVPKKRIPTFLHLDLEDPKTQAVVFATLAALRETAIQHDLSEGYVLVNGGRHQEVPQIHFHLASDPARLGHWRSRADVPPPTDGVMHRVGSALAYPHPRPNMRFHYVVSSTKPVPGLYQFEKANPLHTIPLLDMLRAAQQVIAAQTPGAYMLGTYLGAQATESCLIWHILSGKPGQSLTQ